VGVKHQSQKSLGQAICKSLASQSVIQTLCHADILLLERKTISEVASLLGLADPRIGPSPIKFGANQGEQAMKHVEWPGAGYELDIAGITDPGLVRPSNEDSLVVLKDLVPPSRYLAVAGVFDGVGGLAHGALASSAAAQCLAQIAGDPLSPGSPTVPEAQLEEILRQLHETVRKRGLDGPTLMGMATTATVALLVRACPVTLWIGHVGDSPAFCLRDGQLQKLIREDSLVCDLVRQGLVAPEDAPRHPQRHIITQALGSPQGINPHVGAHVVEPGDCFLLCTDGLTAMVSEKTMRTILDSEPPHRACTELIRAANSAGGIDNVTVIIMKFIPTHSRY